MTGDYNTLWEQALRHFPRDSQFAFEPFLRESVERTLGKAGQEVDAFVEANGARIWTHFKKKNYYLRKQGRIPLFRIIDEKARIICWSSNADQDVGAPGISARPWILSSIDSLTDTEYEYVASCAFQLEGAYTKVSDRSGDNNVDFYATFRAPFQPQILQNVAGDVKIIGQSKKYGAPVSVGKVREFAYTLNEIRHLSSNIRDQIPVWFRSAKGPIVGIILSHTGFQSGAVSKAKQEGVILCDSFFIAETLAVSNLLKGGESAPQRANFFHSTVKNFGGA